jgi:hypothetical protein
MNTTDLVETLSFFLPEETFRYFDLVGGQKTQKEIFLTLEEKNDPPVRPEHAGKQVLSKGFKEVTVTDFPARGRMVTLTFRRRRWQVEGGTELLTRDIRLTAPGTQLEREFAAFLKERG